MCLVLPKPASATPPPGYALEWSDEFDEGVGSAPNPAYWGYDLGDGGWGNNELETYTNNLANAQLIADPNAEDGYALQISAIDENGGVGTAGQYTSARLVTTNNVLPEYGYIEARIQLPYGDGIWPAFWTLGEDIDTVNWPACGEQDIMENIGMQSWWGENAGSLHAPNYNPTADYFLPAGEYFWQGYHKFAELWTPTSITYYVDDVPYESHTPGDLDGGTWEWTANPAYMLLNIAVGGNFPGSPDSTTSFPQTMRIDYVKIYTQPYNGPHDIPGVVQAEDFDNGGLAISYSTETSTNQGGQYRPELGVGIENTSGGGYDVGWTAAGQWMKYAVNVNASGTYNVTVRVASDQTGGGTFHIEDQNGNNLTGPINVPDTNGWQNWTTVSATAALTAGAQVLKVVEDTGGYNLDYFAFTSASGPFDGPHNLPGTVQAEDYDQGGEGVGFHSLTTAANPAGLFRNDPVTVENCAEGGYDVSSTAAGQWLKYTVNVDDTALYNVQFRVTSGAGGGTLHLVDENGNNLTGPVSVPNTGGVQNWTTVDAIVSLTQGTHTLQLIEDTGGYSIDYMTFTTDFNGPHDLPGTVAAADYDQGGAGIAYNMASPMSPVTSNYRGSDAVGIEDSSLGGYDMGWTQAGQWTDYTVYAQYAGTYNVTFTVSSGSNGGTFHVQDENGNNLTGEVNVPATGGWQTWTTVTVPVTLSAGGHVLRLDQDSIGFNIYNMIFAPAAPPAVASISLNPSSVVNNSPSTATVTLAAAAQPSLGMNGQTVVGGEAVLIASDNAVASIPTGNGVFTCGGSTYILIPTGQTSASFTVNTSNVSSPSVIANISASIDGSTESTPLTVTDSTAPATTANIAGAPAGPVTITLSATDPDNPAGSLTTYYAIDGGATETYSGPVTISTPGNYTLTYYSVDPAGNTEATNTATFSIFNAAPALTSLTPSSTTAGVGTTLTINGSGFVSGATVQFGTYSLTPASVTSTAVTVNVPSADVATSGSVQVTVQNPLSPNVSNALVFTVNPVVINPISVAPKDVTGPTDAVVTITLTGPAPQGGAVVKLSSNLPSAANFTTTSITIPAGQTSGTANVDAYPVTTTTSVTLEAKYGVSHTTHLTVLRPKLVTVRISPTSLYGGQSTTGTITLTGPPVVDTTITVTANTSAATIEGPVVVPAGSSTGTFTIKTTPVSTLTDTEITATLVSTDKTLLAIRPPTVKTVAFTPSTVTGGASVSMKVTLTEAAAAGGVAVSMTYPTNGSTLVNPPSTVIVAAGSSSATVTIPTTTVTTATSTTADATIGTTTVSGSLTVDP